MQATTTTTRTTRRTLWRSLPNKRYIVVNIEVRDGDPSGLSDGFSVTGELYEPHGNWSGAAQFRLRPSTLAHSSSQSRPFKSCAAMTRSGSQSAITRPFQAGSTETE